MAILGGYSCTACKIICLSNVYHYNIHNCITCISTSSIFCFINDKNILNSYHFLSGFEVGELSEDGPDDWESLDASAAHIANLLAAEPADGIL